MKNTTTHSFAACTSFFFFCCFTLNYTLLHLTRTKHGKLCRFFVLFCFVHYRFFSRACPFAIFLCLFLIFFWFLYNMHTRTHISIYMYLMYIRTLVFFSQFDFQPLVFFTYPLVVQLFVCIYVYVLVLLHLLPFFLLF